MLNVILYISETALEVVVAHEYTEKSSGIRVGH